MTMLTPLLQANAAPCHPAGRTAVSRLNEIDRNRITDARSPGCAMLAVSFADLGLRALAGESMALGLLAAALDHGAGLLLRCARPPRGSGPDAAVCRRWNTRNVPARGWTRFW